MQVLHDFLLLPLSIFNYSVNYYSAKQVAYFFSCCRNALIFDKMFKIICNIQQNGYNRDKNMTNLAIIKFFVLFL